MIDIDNIDRRYLLAGLIILLVVVFVVGMKYSDIRESRQMEEEKAVEELVNKEQVESRPVEDQFIQVYVTGAVKYPKVCQLKKGARVFEAVDQVELLPTADIKNLNMARVLQDGEPLVVPAVGENPAGISSGSGGLATGGSLSSSADSGLVNINTAPASELDQKLSGIGPTLAQRIIDYRIANGAFEKIEDLKNVSGIGDKKFAAIKDQITVR